MSGLRICVLFNQFDLGWIGLGSILRCCLSCLGLTCFMLGGLISWGCGVLCGAGAGAGEL